MKKRNLLLKTGAPFLLLVVQSCLWAFIWIRYYADIVPSPFHWKGQLLLTILYFIILLVLSNIYKGFRIGFYHATEATLSLILAVFMTNIVAYIITCLIITAIVTPLPIVMMAFIQCVIILGWAFLTNNLYKLINSPRRMILIYSSTKPIDKLVYKLHTRPDKYIVDETLCIDGLELNTISMRLLEFDAVVMQALSPGLRYALQQFCFERSIRTYIVPGITDLLIHSAIEINLFDTPIFLNRNDGMRFEQRIFKRFFDIIFSIFALIITFPFSFIIAVAVKLNDGGPVFYSQERLTINGKCFKLHKFRSMRVNAEEMGAQLSTKEDKRITAVGRVIRTLRFDEIPQFYNVLKGDMSIVGPRPERPEIIKEYLKTIPEFSYRLKVKAGITGYAQVYGNYNTDPWDKLLMDLIYISCFTLVMDMKIILMTFKILLQRRRTLGV